MNIKFSFEETNVQVGFEKQFVIKDLTEKTLVKLLMLKGEKGDTVSGEWGYIIGNLSAQTDLKNALDSKASASDLNTTNTNVATNTSNIATNTGNIATNTAAIEENAEDIADLTIQVGTNTGNIATNTSNIATNTGNIATNTSNIATNTSNIGDLSNLTTTDKTSLVGAVNELNVPAKWVSVGPTAPSNGERVWFAKSRNLLELADKSTTSNGITVVQNTNGLLTFSGTATANSFLRIDKNGTKYTFDLKAGTYTLSANNNLTFTSNDYLRFVTSGGSAITGLSIPLNSINANVTFTINEDLSDIMLQVRFSSGTNANNLILKPQLQEGSTATAYEPYVETGINVDNEVWYSVPKVLYESTTGATTGSITLNDSVANYSCIDVIFSINSFSENVRNYIRLEKYNSTSILGNLFTGQVDSGGVLRVWATRISITNNSVTLERDTCFGLSTSGVSSQSGRIKVLKILGYK